MSVRPSVWRAAPLVLLLLPLLSGCGAGRDQTPPACPSAGLVPPTGDITVYPPGARLDDVANQVLQGRIVAIKGKCRQGGDPSRLGAEATVSLHFTRGPAMSDKSVTVPVFVAVTEGGHVLDKKVFDVAVDFPNNIDQADRTVGPVDMVLPVGPKQSGAAYRIVAGFQLTPAQLKAARAAQ